MGKLRQDRIRDRRYDNLVWQHEGTTPPGPFGSGIRQRVGLVWIAVEPCRFLPEFGFGFITEAVNEQRIRSDLAVQHVNHLSLPRKFFLMNQKVIVWRKIRLGYGNQNQFIKPKLSLVRKCPFSRPLPTVVIAIHAPDSQGDGYQQNSGQLGMSTGH